MPRKIETVTVVNADGEPCIVEAGTLELANRLANGWKLADDAPKIAPAGAELDIEPSEDTKNFESLEKAEEFVEAEVAAAELTVDEMRDYLKAQGVTIHHRTGDAKVRKLYNEHTAG